MKYWRASFAIAAAAALTVSQSGTASVPSSTDTAWCQEAGGPSHLGVAVGEHTISASNVSRLKLRWRYDVPGRPTRGISNPTVAGGRVYVAVGAQLIGLNALTGKPIWSIKLPAEQYGTPSVAAGKVIVGLANGDVRAVDASTGRLVWNRRIGGVYVSAPTIDGSHAFVENDKGLLVSLDVRNGAILWTFHAALDGGQPAVGGGSVFAVVALPFDQKAGAQFYGAVAVDKVTGKRKWGGHEGLYAAARQISVMSGHLVVMDSANYLTGINASTGALEWRRAVGPAVSPGSSGGGGCGPAISGGFVFAAEAPGFGGYDIGSYSATTGKPKWIIHNRLCNQGSIVFANGVVFIPWANELRALDPSSGRTLFTRGVGGAVVGQAVVTGRLVATVQLDNGQMSVQLYGV